MVEHDLSVLDYLSDFICCLYGVPSAYGVVTMPFSVREGTIQSKTHKCNMRYVDKNTVFDGLWVSFHNNRENKLFEVYRNIQNYFHAEQGSM